jgi:endonuclease/exonuclease/phosphatase family metal-dependent hydrolase
MPRFLFTGTWAALALVAVSLDFLAAQGLAGPPLRLRVLSYNIHHGEGIDGRLDLQRIARVIRSAQPDLVALQEVDRKTARTRLVDQPRELSRLTELEVAFGGNLKVQGGDYGNAVLSRLPIARQDNHLLPSIKGGEQRGVLRVDVRLPGERGLLTLWATHFDFRADPAERLAAVAAIESLLADEPRQPALLAGDLNAVPHSEAMEALAKHWSATSTQEMPTSPVVKPKRQIDYVWYRPRDRFRVVEVRVLDEPEASDHRPILAVLELLEP